MKIPGLTRGFSLVEMLVSLAIGMLVLVFAMRVITSAETSKRAALGGSDSMQTGMLAMFSISGDAQQAGFGLNDPILVGCDTRMSDTGGYALAPADRGGVTVRPLAPAVIESGGSGSDRITLYAGSSQSGTGTLRMVSDYDGGTRINVDRYPYGFAIGDVVVVAPEKGDRKCALSQISAAPASSYVMVAGGAGFRYNSGSLGDSYRGAATRIFNLGPAAALSFHTWSTANGFLRLRATDMAGAGAAPVTVADDIVAIKAQYGFDTRTDLGSLVNPVLRVDRWSATMVDADGDSVTGGAGDYAQIAALRIAVIARSKSREMLKNASGACQATPVAPVVFGTQEPQGVTAVPISVNVALPGDATDWHCYRYRVFETIVPLRNARWRP